MPADLVPLERTIAERTDGLADLEVLARSRRIVDRDLAVTAGPLARHDLERVQALIARRLDANRDTLVGVPDRVPALVDESRLVLD